MDSTAAYLEQSALLGQLAATADPSTPVPSCPDWTLRQLLTHVGRGDRWAAMIVGERAQAYVDVRTVPDGKPPEDPAAVADWLAEGARLLIAALEGVGPDALVWSFVGPVPASWWVRRRLHESVVHRADAALALGVPFTVPAEVAADGVSEWLELLTARPADPPLLPAGTTMHLHATDDDLGTGGEWMIAGGDARIGWEHGHGKGTVAVRGTAADLLLAMLRRIPADDARLQVLGEAGVLAGWLARTGF